MHPSADSPAMASATVTAVLGASVSSSNLSGLRKVRLSDRELLERVQRVEVPGEPVNFRALSAKRGWKHVRTGVANGMSMRFRVLRTGQTQSRQCQVVVGGDIQAQVSELVSLLRAPTESESNALLRALYGSHCIYSSLVHAVTSPSSERGSLLSPRSRGSVVAAGQQLMVRTISFVHSGGFNHFKQRTEAPSSSVTTSNSHSSIHRRGVRGAKNEQCCYIELFTPTQEGFEMVFCSLDEADVTAGKAPPERVIALHPVSGWLTAEPKRGNPGTLQFTFQGAFTGEVAGGCDSRLAQARLLFIGRRVCRLEKVLRRRRRYHLHLRTAPGRLWQTLLKPFRALGVVDDENSGGTHHNWHCIACTRSLLPTLRKRWRHCDLCAYRVCAEPPCCSQERVAIYSRYVAPLLVCARCRECIDERDSSHPHSVNRVRGAASDNCYAGVSLRFTNQEIELEPELELDPSDRSRDRLVDGLSGAPRSSGGVGRKRRTQSDPPPMLALAFSSSGDDNSLSGPELVPGSCSK